MLLTMQKPATTRLTWFMAAHLSEGRQPESDTVLVARSPMAGPWATAYTGAANPETGVSHVFAKGSPGAAVHRRAERSSQRLRHQPCHRQERNPVRFRNAGTAD